ncbi:MAG: putative lipid II flippase FtsW [Candidatus Eisenbacteria bacterium]
MTTRAKTTDGFSGERTGPDRWLLMAVLLLVGIGVVMVYSASSFRAAEIYRSSTFFLQRHGIRVLFALAGFFIAYRADYRILTRYSRPLVLTGIVLLALVLVVGPEDAIRGSRRWLRLGPLSFQPSELSKLLLVLYLADFLSRKRNEARSFARGVFPAVVVLGVIVVLIALEKNLSGVLHVSMLASLLLFVGGVRFRYLFLIGLIFGLTAFASVRSNPYQWNRVIEWVDGRSDLRATDYQTDQSLIALGSGGLSGGGFGNSKQKYFFLPDSHTDFVLGIVGEELGFVGAGGVMVLFLVFGWRGARIAANAPDVEGRLLAAGITLLVMLYAMLNVAVVTDAVPTTGVPLPFVSYGGSSLFVALFGAGVLLNISRKGYRRSFATAGQAVDRLGRARSS